MHSPAKPPNSAFLTIILAQSGRCWAVSGLPVRIMGFTPSRAPFLLFLLFLLPLLTWFRTWAHLPKMAWQAEWKLLSAEKKLNKRGFINAQVLATIFTLINPEPRYFLASLHLLWSFDYNSVKNLQWDLQLHVYAGTVLKWWAFLCILRAGLVLGKHQAIGAGHIFELSNLFLSCNNVS